MTEQQTRPYTFEDAEQRLAVALPGYESRPPQQRLAHAIEGILSHGANFTPYDGPEDEWREWERPGIQHLLGQAGCGTGKSLAYLIPAILSGKRIIVSVTTKALQDQIVSTDIPFLQQHLGVDFLWALLKGRGNYLCTSRLALITETNTEDDRLALRALWEASQNPAFTGLREEVSHDIPDWLWAQAASESEECSNNKCTPDQCYAERAREKAAEARLVIANHALFFTDLSIKTMGYNGMLGEYDLVVFDEAHSLEEVAGNILGTTLTEGSFNSLTSQARRWGNDHADDDGEALVAPIDRVTLAAKSFFEKIVEIFKAEEGSNGRIRNQHLNLMTAEIGEIYDAVDTLRKALAGSTYENAAKLEEASKKRWRLTKACYSITDRLGEIVAGDPREVVKWIEREERKGQVRTVIKIAPILVAPFLHTWLFSKVPCVLVSATLAVRGEMSYIAGRVGISEGTYQSLDVGTPFDFSQQGRLYIPLMTPGGEPFPAPEKGNIGLWEGMTIQEIHRLVTASRGRALVLFTSIKHMRSVHESISRMTGNLTYRVQGERGVSNQDLVDWLKAGPATEAAGGPGRVLLATKSFFTGIDIPGDALSLLVIAKMPFPVPTEPLTEARCEAIELAGGSAFTDYTIPVMSLELQQGIGRLIRHRGDRGIAAILDPRMVNKGYGKKVLRDLPPLPQTFDVADVAAFFSNTPEAVPA